MRVLVAARDLRVRRALSGLLELAGCRVVGAVHRADVALEIDTDMAPELVVLELVRGDDVQDLQVVRRLASRGRTVIAVCSGRKQCVAVLALGAAAGLDKDDPGFTERLAEVVHAVADDGNARRRTGPTTAGTGRPE